MHRVGRNYFQRLRRRGTSVFQRWLTTNSHNIEQIESQSYNGIS
jgi:hypothetical protein